MEEKEEYIRVKLSDLKAWRTGLQGVASPKVTYRVKQLSMANDAIGFCKDIAEGIRFDIKMVIEGLEQDEAMHKYLGDETV